jgi:hypothetical protein
MGLQEADQLGAYWSDVLGDHADAGRVRAPVSAHRSLSSTYVLPLFILDHRLLSASVCMSVFPSVRQLLQFFHSLHYCLQRSQWPRIRVFDVVLTEHHCHLILSIDLSGARCSSLLPPSARVGISAATVRSTRPHYDLTSSLRSARSFRQVRVFVSPMQRCMQTADPLVRALNKRGRALEHVTVLPALHEEPGLLHPDDRRWIDETVTPLLQVGKNKGGEADAVKALRRRQFVVSFLIPFALSFGFAFAWFTGPHDVSHVYIIVWCAVRACAHMHTQFRARVRIFMHTHTHAHTHTHTHTHTLTHSLTHSLIHTLTLTHAHTLSWHSRVV